MSEIVSEDYAKQRSLRKQAVESTTTPCGDYKVFVTATAEVLDEPYGSNIYFVEKGDAE